MVDLNKSFGLSRTLLGLSCFLLSSCAVTGSDYETKLNNAPASYGILVESEQSKSSLVKDSQISANFYKDYQDPFLNKLVEIALRHNYDLNDAWINLKQAENQLKLSGINMHPSLDASLNSSYRKQLYDEKKISRSSGANLGISYEVDLFNRLEHSQQASYEAYQASKYDLQAMRLAIIEKTSEYYWKYLYAQEALKLAEQQLQDSQKRLDLIQAKVASGAVDGLEYDRALVNHRNVEQNLYLREYELTLAGNALCTVLGFNTETDLIKLLSDPAITVAQIADNSTVNVDDNIEEGTINKGNQYNTLNSISGTVSKANVMPMSFYSRLSSSFVPNVNVDQPVSLLKKRPDLMAYEARLKEQMASLQVAKDDFYPTIKLNAVLSASDSASLIKFFTDPLGSISGAIALPFLNYNELSVKEDNALLSKERAQLNFANGFIVAVQEVADKFNEMRYNEKLLASANDELRLTASNYQRIEQKYKVGASSLSDLLDAADSLRSAQNKVIQSKRELLISSMMLMVALGGDSTNTPVETITPKISKKVVS